MLTMVYAGVGVAGFNTNPPRDDREGVLISHGVGSLVASVKSRGFEVDFIDLRQLSGWEEFEDMVRQSDNQVYGVSISPVDYAPAMQAILSIKTIKPQAKVIVGGIHPSVHPDMYNFKAIATVVKGEGEITLPDLLEMILKNKELPRIIEGVKPNLNRIPWVDRDIFDYSKELTKYFAEDHAIPTVTMLAGRGCPYHCNYCQPAENAVFGTPFRMRSPENVMAELYALKIKYNFRSIVFWDDTFTLNKKWLMKFADFYEKSNMGASIAACSRADIICHNPDMVKRLAEIGVDWLVIGMESGSQRVLDMLNKGTTVEQNIQAADICHEYGIKVFATIMYGLPTETNAEVDQTNAMLEKSKVSFISPFWYVPIPGTKLYDFCVEKDLLLNDDKLAQTIERTGFFRPTLKNVDYDYMMANMPKNMYQCEVRT